MIITDHPTVVIGGFRILVQDVPRLMRKRDREIERDGGKDNFIGEEEDCGSVFIVGRFCVVI